MCNSLKFAQHCIRQSVRWEREREMTRQTDSLKTLTSALI